MKHFTNDAIITAKERTASLIVKLGSLKPTEEFTIDDIRGIMFYLKDYKDELIALEHRRSKK